MSKYIWRILLMALFLALSVSSIQAQVELDATYLSHDGSFTFKYPDHGQAIVDDETYVGSVQITVPLDEQDYLINVFSPWLTMVQIDGVQSLEMAKDVLTQRMVSDTTSFEINTVQSHQALEFIDETGSFWILIELDNAGFALVSVHADGQRRSRLRSLARDIALSYSYSYPVIEKYAGNWNSVIDELQQKAIITRPGSLVFANPDTLSNWGQTWLMDSYSKHTNLVMSAEITVHGSATCALMAHVQSRTIKGSEEIFSLKLSLNSYGTSLHIGYNDQFGVMSRAFEFVYMPIEADSSHYYLMLTDDHSLSIYVDGNPLVEHVPIAPVEGDYGLDFDPFSADSQCEVSNLWVYQHDLPLSDATCQAVISSPAEAHLWPNHAEVVETISEGETIPLSCHHVMDSGKIWYMLSNGLWVESSNVRLIGDCGTVPVIY